MYNQTALLCNYYFGELDLQDLSELNDHHIQNSFVQYRTDWHQIDNRPYHAEKHP
ncbi:hypothetical protein [Pedobacter sp. L105]|uniref:hypothetical protein n=1 Tax=Pedobacter sp. L105 TaxID=1641871 RepID=UPI00131DE992|nr:hypothetical protein [Pedobacter sp. L105]